MKINLNHKSRCFNDKITGPNCITHSINWWRVARMIVEKMIMSSRARVDILLDGCDIIKSDPRY